MNKDFRVAVLMGGDSREREISLKSGEAILQSLLKNKIQAFSFDPKEKALYELKQEQVDLAFIALHGKFGEDGTAQAILEFLKIPYTGSGVAASALATNKILTKRVWRSFDIETPPFRTVNSKENLSNLDLSFDYPAIVKPNDEGSSFGVVKVKDSSSIRTALKETFRFCEKALVEKFIEGREFTCTLLRDPRDCQVTALPIVEIDAPGGDYNYYNKYFGNKTNYICPAKIPKEIENQMKSKSLLGFEALGCEGWARVDLMWNGKDSPQLIELNTSPGMTNHSLVPMAAQANGINFDDLVLRILKTASLGKKGSYDD
jgi:D-alanine-D-alanine ligase